MRNFLSLYNLTIGDENPGNQNGSWEEWKFVNGDSVRTALFGSGSQGTSLISHVFVGDGPKVTSPNVPADRNSLPLIRAVVGALGIAVGTSDGHENHFHVDFRTPERVPITPASQNLLTEAVAETEGQITGLTINDVSSFIAQTQAELGLEQGDLTMLAFDIPDVPHLYAGALVAQSNEARKRLENSERAIGVCFGAHNPPGGEYATALSPQSAARAYFGLFEKKEVDDPPLSNVELLVQPKNGKVVYSKYEDGLLHPTYIPSAGYFGDERIVFQVNVEGKSVRVVYVLKVTKHLTGGQLTNEYFCKRDFWKISSTGDGSWELQDIASNEPGNDTTAGTTNSGFPFGPLSANHEGVRYAGLGSTNADSPYTFNNISVTFAALEGQAVGNTMGGRQMGVKWAGVELNFLAL